jgi:hypothetical protein
VLFVLELAPALKHADRPVHHAHGNVNSGIEPGLGKPPPIAHEIFDIVR